MSVEEIKIIKKDGTKEPWSYKKLIDAINKSCLRARDCYMTPDEEDEVTAMIAERVEGLGIEEIPTSRLHSIVEQILLSNRFVQDIGEAYFNYHTFAKQRTADLDGIINNINANTFGNQSNANADSTLASTLSSLSSDEIETYRFEHYFLTAEERKASNDGYIYFHDKGKRMNYPLNCCLFRIFDVMENGFEMNGIPYTKPHSLKTAFSQMSDVILACASQQYGGFTVPEVDKLLAPYAQKTYDKQYSRYISIGLTFEQARQEALKV